ncbi:ammonium transporter [Frigoriglobus tundricola]|uniref:Ammonium transporter n=1 Tax=Frigoriglobus tundricola TaxID=2774151 RepID=A0A6M5YJY4_9BACT|nr:ammonium transporter [Frigoriglobus tundricola]QJW93611.1 Ammonium transporter [Frigoriglobus tundricola]
MAVSRLLGAFLLLATCAAMPTKWAPVLSTASAQDEKKSQNPKSGSEETAKALADLKSALEAAQKELTATSKALSGLKADSDAGLKKAAARLDALQKEIAALSASAKASVTKADLAVVAKKADEVTADVAAIKAAGDGKATVEKLAALEKGADEIKKAAEKAGTDAGVGTTTAKERGDTAWMLISSALVLLMVPGLALFYGGMVRRKNVLATMMQSMAALAVVGVYWIAIGYGLAFGPSLIQVSALGATDAGIIGWSWDLFFLKGIAADMKLPANDITVYLHVLFQGMFAIITPALISGAIAERIRFWPFCLFMLLWVTFVYCPLAHMVWAFDWYDTSVLAAKRGGAAIGLLGKMGALDFAGGTVVHIAAGMAGLAACLVLGKRHGYPQQVAHPNSMVLTLLGAGLLWFGWFGFNGGSASNSSPLAVTAFAATQAAAAAAGLAWMLVEWIHKGKPTALGLASGIVAGLVAVTPASGYVYMWGGLLIGIAAAVVCYLAVALKNVLGYDDSLDAFGVHGVGGFVGAVLTGVFCSALANSAGADGPFAYSAHRARYEELKPVEKDGATIDAEPIAKAKAAKREANGAWLKATRDVSADVEKLGIAALEKALADAKAPELTKELADLKLDDLEDELAAHKGPSEAKARIEKELADAKAKAAPIQKKLDAVAETTKKLEEAKAKEADLNKQLDAPKAALEDKAAVLTALEKERDALKALIEKQDDKEHEGKEDYNKKHKLSQLFIQIKAAVLSAVFAFVLSLLLVLVTSAVTLGNFKTDAKGEADGLDRTEHGEVGFDFSAATESVTVVNTTPRAATEPRGDGRFEVVVSGADAKELMHVWSELCQPTESAPDPDFLAVYPHVTTIRGTTFRFRGGEPAALAKKLESLFARHTKKPVTAATV